MKRIQSIGEKRMRKINKISKQLVAITVATLLLPTPTFIYAKEQNSSILTENDTVIEETISTENDTIIEETIPTENDTTIKKPMPKAKQKPKPKPKSGQKVVQIPNKIIKAAINKELGQAEQADITEKQLASIKNLDLWDAGLTTLSGMPEMPNLVSLELGGNKLSNLSGLPKLPKLKKLYLSSKKSLNLSELKKLQQLEELSLRCGLTSLSGMPEMSNLVHLDLEYNKLSSLSGLPKLPKLKSLDVSDNRLKNLSGISKLSKLEELRLARNRLTNLSGISKLSKLSELNLYSNKLKNLKELHSLPSLTNIDIEYNPLKDQNDIVLLAKKNKRLKYITHSSIGKTQTIEKKMNSIKFEYVILPDTVPEDMVMWKRVKKPRSYLQIFIK